MSIVTAQPNGAGSIAISDSGRNAVDNLSVGVDAQAGNVTALVISDIINTQAWQGYYGNISGSITLDDADNFTLYDWQVADAAGEIYASNATGVDWTKIYCVNVSPNRNNVSNIEHSSFNGSQLELDFGINTTDKDGLNETFNDTYIDTIGFEVGSITINNEDGCSMARPYVTGAYSDSAYQEVILSDNNSLIFTSLLLNDQDSYQDGAGDTADFEMLVLEDGHTANGLITTSYNFYVELT